MKFQTAGCNEAINQCGVEGRLEGEKDRPEGEEEEEDADRRLNQKEKLN